MPVRTLLLNRLLASMYGAAGYVDAPARTCRLQTSYHVGGTHTHGSASQHLERKCSSTSGSVMVSNYAYRYVLRPSAEQRVATPGELALSTQVW
jgi:hypothetical protein